MAVSRTIFQSTVFVLTFISYALFHMQRRTLSYVEKLIVSEWTPSTSSLNTSHGDPTWTRQNFFQDVESAEVFLGVLNAIFLSIYAVALYISGALADRLDKRLFLSVSMTLSAVVMFIFGPVLEWSGNYSQGAYLALNALHGLLQSAAWPCVVAIMGAWFSKETSKYLMGAWSSSPSAGSVVSALLMSSILNFGYEYAFLLTSSLLFSGGVLVFFGLVPSPQEVGLTPPHDHADQNDDDENDGGIYDTDFGNEHLLQDETVTLLKQKPSSRTSYGTQSERQNIAEKTHSGECPFHPHQDEGERHHLEDSFVMKSTPKKESIGIGQSVRKNDHPNLQTHISTGVSAEVHGSSCTVPRSTPKAINLFQALLLPGVIAYALANFFAKMVVYVFFFWLPYFLSFSLGYPETTAASLSLWYDVGAMVGGIVIAFFLVKLDKYASIMSVILLCSLPLLYVFGTLSQGYDIIVHGILLFTTGWFIGGVSNIISASISSDIGRREAARSNVAATSTIAGIVEGTGTVGAIIGQLAVPYLSSLFGWDAVFFFEMVAIALSVFCMLPTTVMEVKDVFRKRSEEATVSEPRQVSTTNM